MPPDVAGPPVSPTPRLSWALVVATYQREQVLPICLRLAAAQSRKPVDIVVVDASPNWEQTRDRILAEMAVHHPDIRWVYVAAEGRSSTLQRNQGLPLTTADVVFLLDDDSLMFPNCAEEIMRVYEADVDGVVQGVCAEAADRPPAEVEISDTRKATGGPEHLSGGGLGSQVKQFLWRHLFLMDTHALFLPYDGRYPQHELPEAVRRLNVTSVGLFQGFRMTYRRSAVTREPFEPLLRYYAAGEDLDASYRVSRHGPLVVASDAKLFHFQSAGGRLPRFKVSALSALNQALFLRRNSSNLRRDRWAYYRLMVRRVLAEVLKDGLSRRWTLPQARGLVYALRQAPRLFAMNDEQLAEWYVPFQRHLLES